MVPMSDAKPSENERLPLPFVLTREQMTAYTRQYAGERFADGRPKVPDSILERMKRVTCEQAWTVLREHGYECQYQGKWVVTHENPLLVGRAVTCNFIPQRPDLADVVNEQAKSQGLVGRDKHWVMDRLERNDVIVADLLDRQIGGGFIGDNLANMIYDKTGTGCVVWGGTRDLAGVLELEDSKRASICDPPKLKNRSVCLAHDQARASGRHAPTVVVAVPPSTPLARVSRRGPRPRRDGRRGRGRAEEGPHGALRAHGGAQGPRRLHGAARGRAQQPCRRRAPARRRQGVIMSLFMSP